MKAQATIHVKIYRPNEVENMINLLNYPQSNIKEEFDKNEIKFIINKNEDIRYKYRE